MRLDYTDLKSIIAAKSLLWQYNEFTETYHVFAVDGTVTYGTRLYKPGFEPVDCTSCAADTTDFETNYKSGANEPVGVPAHVNLLVYGHTNVTTAGTRVLLIDGTTKTHTITIKANSTNTGNIYVGDDLVTSANGFILEPGTTMSIDHDNKMKNVYIDADTNGEGVSHVGGCQV